MILLFPTLIEGINTEKGRDTFAPTCHMFYGSRVVDLKDGKVKWTGLDKESKYMDEDGNVLPDDEQPKKDAEEEKKRKRVSDSQSQPTKK